MLGHQRVQRGIVTFGALVSLACLSSTSASAQGWLVGGSAGQAKQYDYSVGEGEIVATTDDTDTGFRVFGGYLFHPNMGVVVSYVDLGELYYDGPAFGGFTDYLDAKGIDASFLGSWRPGSQKRFTLFGTVGVFRWQQDVNYTDPSGNYPYEDKGTSFSYGAGGEVSIGAGAHWGFHFSYQRFMDVGDANNSGHEYDRDLISAGVDYRFGK